MSDLVPLAPMISREGYLFAFPNAPIPMDFGLGMVGYAWSAPLEADFDDDGRAESLLEGFVDDVTSRYGVEEGRVVLGGFSQGGMMAFRHGLRHADRFPGIVALSSRLPPQDRPSESGGPPPLPAHIHRARHARRRNTRPGGAHGPRRALPQRLPGRVPRVRHGPPDYPRSHRRSVRLAYGHPATFVLNPS